jgi:hypothetical protein
MLKIIVAALAILSLWGTSSADAASKRKRQKVHVAPIAAVPAVPYGVRTPGPPWAQPWECYTDEGYGRYTPCGAGKDD